MRDSRVRNSLVRNSCVRKSRLRDVGALVVLFLVAVHLMGCVHAHGPAFGASGASWTMGDIRVTGGAFAVATPPAPAAPATAATWHDTAATPHDRTSAASAPQPGPCCPDAVEHAADRVRGESFSKTSKTASTGALPAAGQSAAVPGPAPGACAARSPDGGPTGGRGILTGLCVARI